MSENPSPPATPPRPRYVEQSPNRVHRFWTDVTLVAEGQGVGVRLDGRPPKTPAGHMLILPTKASAQLVADEWAAQGEVVDAATMPATRLAYTAIDRVSGAREAVADEIAAYAGSDVLCYLAQHPGPLVEQQARQWAPWRDWAARDLAVPLECTDGVVHRPQDLAAIARVKALALDLDEFALTGLGAAVPLLGSAILGLALQRGVLAGEAALDLSRLDEAFQESQWGIDAEALERTAARRAEADMLDRWFRTLEAA